MRYCSQCGKPMEDTAAFCPNCGCQNQEPAQNAAPQQPYSAPQQPYSAPQQPNPAPQQPNPAPQQPYSAPQQPNPAPQQPNPAPQQTYATPQQTYAAPQQPYGVPQQPMNPAQMDVQNNKVMAVLAYIGILFLVPLLAAKDSPYAKFHTNQGVVLFIVSILWSIVGSILKFIPYIGALVSGAGSILLLVLAIIGIVNAVKGEMKELPVIGTFRIVK